MITYRKQTFKFMLCAATRYAFGIIIRYLKANIIYKNNATSIVLFVLTKVVLKMYLYTYVLVRLNRKLCN